MADGVDVEEEACVDDRQQATAMIQLPDFRES